jgi:hypothetical protein
MSHLKEVQKAIDLAGKHHIWQMLETWGAF